MECDNYLQYKPAKSGLAARQIEVTGLNHFADYKFKVRKMFLLGIQFQSIVFTSWCTAGILKEEINKIKVKK